MSKSIMDNLTKALEMNRLVVEEEKIKEQEAALPVVKTEKTQADIDFELVRSNLKDLVTKGNDSLESLILLAKASEHPRAFEVLATFIKTLSDANKDILDINKKRLEIKKVENGGVIEPTKSVTNNNLFVGTTADLQKFLRDRSKTIEHDESNSSE
jgi:hypothetical protein